MITETSYQFSRIWGSRHVPTRTDIESKKLLFSSLLLHNIFEGTESHGRSRELLQDGSPRPGLGQHRDLRLDDPLPVPPDTGQEHVPDVDNLMRDIRMTY